MTGGDFAETAARAALDRALAESEAAKQAAIEAYARRERAADRVREAREVLALVLAFPEGAPRIGDPWPPVEVEGLPRYPAGVVSALSFVTDDSRTASRVTSVRITIATPVGTYVVRRLVEPRTKRAAS